MKKGFNVKIEAGAGFEAKFRDEDYKAAGGNIVDNKGAFDSGKLLYTTKHQNSHNLRL